MSPVGYSLYKNNLTNGVENNYAARVRIKGTVGFEALAQKIVDRGSTVNKADIRAVLEDSVDAIQVLLLDGFRLNFGGLCEFYPRIRGNFTGRSDQFDRSRHFADIGCRPTRKVLKKFRMEATVTKLDAIEVEPKLHQFLDVESGLEDQKITPVNISSILGRRLQFDPDATDEGVFIRPLNGDPEVRLSKMQRNKPRELVFFIPDLDSGDYELYVRNRINGSPELREGKLKATLTVD